MKIRISSLVPAAGALLLGVMATQAHAWEHIGVQWDPAFLPIVTHTADDGTENTIARCEATEGISGCCEETVPQGYCLEAAILGADAWLDAPCADVQFDVVDTIANPELAAVNTSSFALTDFFNHITFNDPDDVLGPGTLAAQSRQLDPGAQVIVGDSLYNVQVSGDVTFNDNVVFVTVEEVDNNDCNGESSMAAVMAHELGHQLGMDHSCENPELPEGGPCTDRRLFEATMYWTGPPCDNEQLTISEDDIEGITALYGPSASFSCSRQVTDGLSVGVVPFEINCAITSRFLNEVTDASWLWGDGATSEGLTTTHEYTEPGNYTVEVEVNGEREACGPDGWSNTFRRVGYVRACDVPEAGFEVQQIDGLRYQFLNDSDVSVFGCISDIQWDIYRGDSPNGEPVGDPISAWEPEVTFPEPGQYHVVMSLGGIAGTGGASATFDVRRTGGTQTGFGCNTGLAPAGALTLGLGLIGLVARRRRRD
ncbi:MAG: PKD domain-containing protein [Myxococcota bacterium]